jgi:hypothetical protein
MKVKLLDDSVLEFKYIYLVREWETTDADTIKVTLDQGFRELRIQEPLRLYNCDAPEITHRKSHGKLAALHKEAGLMARGVLYRFLDHYLFDAGTAWELFAVSMELDGRGRSIGDLLLARKDDVDDRIRRPISVRNSLISRGVLRECIGGKREPWSREELEAVIRAAQQQEDL